MKGFPQGFGLVRICWRHQKYIIIKEENTMERYCMYLRKSRKDMLAEEHGEGETLKRHEKMLFSLANQMKIIIDENSIYREVVSGETIASRPVMQQLLTDVENGLWTGVLVVEVERLARGDTMDQGLVSQVFKFSNTRIITPLKTYEPDNESDEEYFEFGLFMSRREYKKINQRLNNGRIASVNEGKYVGNIAPYGYERVKIKGDKGFSLVENKEESETVKLIFQWYAHEQLSYSQIIKKLDGLGIIPRMAEQWRQATIKDILSNPVYIGMIRWKARKLVKTSKNGSIKISRPRNTEDILLRKGLHTALIDEETWSLVEERRKLHTPKVPKKKEMQNPLSGIVVCGKCGKFMQRRPYNQRDQEPSLICMTEECDNISSKLGIVEQKILESLRLWLNNYTVDFEQQNKKDNDYVSMLENSLSKLKKELAKAEKRLENICTYFEEGTYTKEIYFERSKVAVATIDELRNRLSQQQELLDKVKDEQNYKDEFIPKVKNVIDLYNTGISIEDKNNLLKAILEKVLYTKTEKALKKTSDPTNFQLDIFPKISKRTD